MLNLGVHVNKSFKERHPAVYSKNFINQYSAISRKRCETGCKLVLFTYRKSHTNFQLVSKVVILNAVKLHNSCSVA